jgi:hypothetical protein
MADSTSSRRWNSWININPFTYWYQPLHSATSFRILILLPGESIDQIKVNIEAVEFDETPQYEALSYCWGGTPETSPYKIRVGLQSMRVTPNLHNALVHLRYKDKSRILWVDAVW